jgi:hypothetical protein
MELQEFSEQNYAKHYMYEENANKNSKKNKNLSRVIKIWQFYIGKISAQQKFSLYK